MKIVIVDDDKAMRGVLRALCEGEGHEVIAEFGDGVGLVDYVATHDPDLVCLDFNLPGEDGLSLLFHMDTAANQVDVIMISGSDDPALQGHAADLGANGFIHKPFKLEQVIAELKEIEQARRIAARAAGNPVKVELPTIQQAAVKCVPIEPVKPVVLIPEPPSGVVSRSAVIVDDSGSVRLLLKGIFEDMGIKVLGTAATGKEGVEVVRKTHPAMVCLDVDMPEMTGIEALPLVRAASPLTRVVMITGNASRDIVQAAVSGGARGYFLKPIRPAKVAEFVQKLLQFQ